MSKILIADDSPELLEIFKQMLEKAGHEVRTSLYRYSLMNALANFKPDLIILNALLRANNGREICQEIKTQAETKNMPVILMSECPENLMNYKECNADEVLEKPFNLKDVLKKVRSVLNLYQHGRNRNVRPVNVEGLEIGFN